MIELVHLGTFLMMWLRLGKDSMVCIIELLAESAEHLANPEVALAVSIVRGAVVEYRLPSRGVCGYITRPEVTMKQHWLRRRIEV